MKPCGVPWPICPDCLGEPLYTSGGSSRCPRCRRRWLDVERNPCPDEQTATVRDTAGGAGPLCRSHAVRAHAQIVGSTVEGLDSAALEIAAGLWARDKETAAMHARDDAQEAAELAGHVAPLTPERRAEVDSFTRELRNFRRAFVRDDDKDRSR